MSFYNTSEIASEQRIVELHESGMSQSEIADKLNVTKERIDYVMQMTGKTDYTKHNGENKKARESMKGNAKGISERKKELWNKVAGFHNEGLTQKQIAIKLNRSQSYIAKVIRDIRYKEPTLLKDKDRDHGTRRRYTKEEKEALTIEVVEMYNSGMTVEEIANKKDKASSTVERWISDARKAGKKIRPSRKGKQIEPDEAKQNTENDKLIEDIVNAINTFADSHFLLGKHIEKLFELLERRESDGRR